MKPRTVSVLGIAACALIPRAASAQATFDALGDLPGGAFASFAAAISADGSVVVGSSRSAASAASSIADTEAFRWSEASGMEGLGDLSGGRFDSEALAVSAGGMVVAGVGADGTVAKAFRWTSASGMVNLGVLPGGTVGSRARGVSAAGDVVVGSSSSRDAQAPFGSSEEAFRWTAAQGMEPLGFIGDNSGRTASAAQDVSPGGDFIAGSSTSRDASLVTGKEAFLWTEGGGLEPLGFAGDCGTAALGVSGDGGVVVGFVDCDGATGGAFRWTRTGGMTVFLEGEPGLREVSADGRVAVGSLGRFGGGGERAAVLFEEMIFDLQDLVEATTDIDLTGWELREAVGISADGTVIAGNAASPEGLQAWRLTLSDCNENAIPDEIEVLVLGELLEDAEAQGTALFAGEDRGLTVTYGSQIAAYGRPWPPDTDQTPAADDPELAARLRALIAPPDCSVPPERILDHYRAVVFPAARELHKFEMLLGNEAFADAADPTIGLDGIAPADLGDFFAFERLPGVSTLLDERLVLLRGRDLPGTPADWIDDDLRYPEFGSDPDRFRAAVYNRLLPNASRSLAYQSNYQAADDLEGALAYPQGHGDAYGYYLRAVTAYVDLLREDPETPQAALVAAALLSPAAGAGAVELRSDLAAAMAARARAASEITAATFRRDYVEDPEDPLRSDLFLDPDPERAWSAADWARRGSIGALLDWALLQHVTPPGSAPGAAERQSLAAAAELAAHAAAMQGQVDAAATGLDPLGLLPNVVPFGIDASSLDTASGKSHYEQVRDAAVSSLGNARAVLELANRGTERLREVGEDLEDIEEQLLDEEEDFHQRLIEAFGQPSIDDPLDNDLDASTDDVVEARQRPDLVRFLIDDQALAALGFAPRAAPGQIQLALSELRIAELRVSDAEAAIDAWEGQVESLEQRISLLQELALERTSIISEACEDKVELNRRLEDIKERKRAVGLLSGLATNIIKSFSDPSALLDSLGEGIEFAFDRFLDNELGNEFDVEEERIRSQCWKDLALTGISSRKDIDAEVRRLSALLADSPRLLLQRATALELAVQALGRLRGAVRSGKQLLAERRRVEEALEADLVEARWKDMSFRVFRNNALSKYSLFFDLAARYVVLAARAYSYEFNSKAEGDDVLSGIYRELRLGNATGTSGGLQGTIARLDASVLVNNFNRPLETLGQLSFSLRRNLLGIPLDDVPEGDLGFRRFLEGSIVQQLEENPVIRDFAQVSIDRDFGPAIVVPFITEVGARNFFAQGPEPPFGNVNFSLTRNPKIRVFAIRLDGVTADLGIDPVEGGVTAFLIPSGDSILREDNNLPRIEDEPIVSWAVVDQFLPAPPAVTAALAGERSFSPWRETAQAGGNFLNAVKRQRDVRAELELGQPLFFNTTLAGRSAWNTAWILAIPGSQWTSSSDPAVIRSKLLQLIYGDTQDPARLEGITDIRWIVQAYTH